MLLALSINTEQSIDSLIFYIIQYSLTNLNTFLIILAFGYVINNSLSKTNKLATLLDKESDKDIKFIAELKGQFFSNPLLSLALSICLFSMAGIPPLIGFFSKQFVLYSAIQSGYFFMSIVAILVSVISASYYLKIIRVLHSGTPVTDPISLSTNANPLPLQPEFIEVKDSNPTINTTSDLTNYHSFLISSLTLSILLFVLKPSIILNSTQLLALSLFNC